MIKELQRVAIAEACGWTQIENLHTMIIGGHWFGYPPKNAFIGDKDQLPRFCDDLNAMHEAEKTLTGEQRYRYADILPLDSDLKSTVLQQAFFDVFIHATAARRAECFLKAIGKWEASPR